MNKIIRYLLLSDVFFLTGLGLIAPILAIYINDYIEGGSLMTAGVASAIFLITKSVVQIPFSKYVDQQDETSDLYWLLGGAFLVCLVPFGYLLAHSIAGIYVAQFLYGLGAGFAYPTWLTIWSHHLDTHHETFEWSFYSSAVSLSTAAAGITGAWVSSVLGFDTTFFLVGICSFGGFVLLALLRTDVVRQHKRTKGITLEFPDLRQTYTYDCGACALESILAYYGVEVREEFLMKEARTTKRDGTGVHRMVQTVHHHGLKTTDGEMTLTDLKKYLRNHIPVVILLQAWTEQTAVDWKNDWDDGHYVVAIGFDDERLIFEDPSSFERTYLPYDEFRKRWHDVDVNGKRYYNYGIAVYGKKPVFCNHTLLHMD